MKKKKPYWHHKSSLLFHRVFSPRNNERFGLGGRTWSNNNSRISSTSLRQKYARRAVVLPRRRTRTSTRAGSGIELFVASYYGSTPSDTARKQSASPFGRDDCVMTPHLTFLHLPRLRGTTAQLTETSWRACGRVSGTQQAEEKVSFNPDQYRRSSRPPDRRHFPGAVTRHRGNWESEWRAAALARRLPLTSIARVSFLL